MASHCGTHPTVPVRCSWHAVFTLLLKSFLVWMAASFRKHWREEGGIMKMWTVLERQVGNWGDWFYLRELSDDSVPSNRRKDAHGWNSDGHEASRKTAAGQKDRGSGVNSLLFNLGGFKDKLKIYRDRNKFSWPRLVSEQHILWVLDITNVICDSVRCSTV